MSDPQRRPPADIRVGSSTNGLVPVSVAERSLGAGPWQWGGLAVVAIAAILADQVTKHIVTHTLGLDEAEHVIGPLSIHHVQNSGIAFGLFSSATAGVTVITAIAVIWMVAFFARSGSRHPVLPAALGLADRRQRLEPHRPHSPWACHRLHRFPLLAGVQSR